LDFAGSILGKGPPSQTTCYVQSQDPDDPVQQVVTSCPKSRSLTQEYVSRGTFPEASPGEATLKPYPLLPIHIIRLLEDVIITFCMDHNCVLLSLSDLLPASYHPLSIQDGEYIKKTLTRGKRLALKSLFNDPDPLSAVYITDEKSLAPSLAPV
ncbi:hypothetical protein STEG23_025778, partial [Scotinomys teguina]